jgi:hypothetical protein
MSLMISLRLYLLTIAAKGDAPARDRRIFVGKKARSDPPQDERAFPLAAPPWASKPPFLSRMVAKRCGGLCNRNSEKP